VVGGSKADYNSGSIVHYNLHFHKSRKVKEAIEKAGCTLLYLPVYSPDLNPIEHCWANFKNYLRKIIKQFDNLSTAITVAMAKTFPG
jgi:transposase